jgi:DNA-binding response OmpR family regulator
VKTCPSPAPSRNGERLVRRAHDRLAHARGAALHRELKLTAKEFDLLWFLARHPRRSSRDQLMDRVWDTYPLDTGTVTVHVRRLREKIEADPSEPEYLETVWGVGYRLVM